MNRTLKRPMFRMGGAAEGITSGLDREPLKQGTDPYDRAIKTTDRFAADMDRYKGQQAPLMPGGLPNFLTSFGLNLLSELLKIEFLGLEYALLTGSLLVLGSYYINYRFL